jgi:hypothetical protein
MKDRQQCVELAKREVQSLRSWADERTRLMLSALTRSEYDGEHCTAGLLAGALNMELLAQRLEAFIKAVPTIPFDQDVESALKGALYPSPGTQLDVSVYEAIEKTLRIFADEVANWHAVPPIQANPRAAYFGRAGAVGIPGSGFGELHTVSRQIRLTTTDRLKVSPGVPPTQAHDDLSVEGGAVLVGRVARPVAQVTPARPGCYWWRIDRSWGHPLVPTDMLATPVLYKGKMVLEVVTEIGRSFYGLFRSDRTPVFPIEPGDFWVAAGQHLRDYVTPEFIAFVEIAAEHGAYRILEHEALTPVWTRSSGPSWEGTAEHDQKIAFGSITAPQQHCSWLYREPLKYWTLQIGPKVQHRADFHAAHYTREGEITGDPDDIWGRVAGGLQEFLDIKAARQV